ncbi:hypothetical protein [Akkermansia sp.]|uniref:hypothetical protein n=1 Tax=Akkermansia sp. TaxID=1872421 RepID=UPI0025C5F3BE|nr:hypothetical protein [Akkermansia sp.]MCC8149820.1 hypothetical protein [Akkermansia sp.]
MEHPAGNLMQIIDEQKDSSYNHYLYRIFKRVYLCVCAGKHPFGKLESGPAFSASYVFHH